MSSVTRFLDPALLQRLNSLQLSARSVVEGTTIGAHRSPVKGASVEFRQHRIYVPGDELRRLDWRVLGRTDRPYVREYDEETNLRCLLLLDGSGSMAYAGAPSGAARNPALPQYAGETAALAPMSKFDYATRIVASLAYLMLGQTESVGIATFRDRIEQWLPPHAGSAQLSRVIDVLERTAPRGLSTPGAAMRACDARLERRSLVIAVSDFFAPIAGIRLGLAHLRHARHEVIAIQLIHRDEESFPFHHWMHFRGLEGRQNRLFEPVAVRKAYLANFQRHQAELKAACGAAGAEFHSIATDTPLINALMDFLQRRQLAHHQPSGR